MKCFFHSSDNDGRCSAAIVKLKHPECELIGVSHPDGLKVSPSVGETIVVVDYSFSEDEMVLLTNLCNLIWIDHHTSSRELAEELISCGAGNIIHDTSCAACLSTWKYFYPDTEVPETVQLCSNYDIWNHSEDGREIFFNYGSQSRECNPRTSEGLDFWEACLVGGREHETISNGEIIASFMERHYESKARSSYSLKWNNWNILAINSSPCTSLTLEDKWDPEKYDFMIIYYFNGKKWRVSMYHNNEGGHPDLSVIAKEYGGGGHPGSAGFYCTELPWIEYRTQTIYNKFEELTFCEAFSLGLTTVEELDDWVSYWHDDMKEEGVSLADHLGLSVQEYISWAEKPKSIHSILRWKNISLTK